MAMTDSSGQVFTRVPPKLIVSQPEHDGANTSNSRPTLASRRRSKTESSAAEGAGKQAGIEWIDVEQDKPPRRRRRSKRSIDGSSASSSTHSRRNTESVIGGFFPKLSRILETSESRPTSRPSTSGTDARKRREQSSPRKPKHRDDVSIGYRRPVRHRAAGVHRRSESGFKVNPSMLSVLSSLTKSSGSSSNTTITQRSYDRRSDEGVKRIVPRSPTESGSEPHAKKPSSPNVFDYMETASTDDGHDSQSIYSSSSSQYEPSDAGSSQQPDTPSSQSTLPSPIATRHSSLNGSVAELRRRYDSQCAASTKRQIAVRSDSNSPAATSPRPRKLSKMKNDLDEHEEDADTKTRSNTSHGEGRRSSAGSSSSSSSSRSKRNEVKQRQEDAARYHLVASQQGPHMIDPVCGQHRSHSVSSHGSAESAQRAFAQAQSQAHYMAMQQYRYSPSPVHPIPPQAVNGHVAQVPNIPIAPDAPDLGQRTLAGYEQLAVELSEVTSPIVPMYRKFEYLNHRILLHLQDELSEMEEHLRQLDEIIAQSCSPPGDEKRPPASRRGDSFSGSDIHHQRTALLGRIFLKTEQYNRAMSSFATMTKGSRPAEHDQIAAYQEWLKQKSPVHEIETRFLQSEHDLILPGQPILPQPRQPVQEPYGSTTHAALTCLPVALMLPLLLFALIPTLTGRLVVTTLIACGSCLVAATTRIRYLMPAREWAICGVAYVLLMAAIAGCIPQYGSGVKGGTYTTYRR